MATLVYFPRTAFIHAARSQLWIKWARNVSLCARSSPAGVYDHSAGTRTQLSLPTVMNTVSGRLDPLPEPSAGPLKWYSCGPTVYDKAHLGHARTYVCLDIIRRILMSYFHFDVTYVLGMTDVDDKIINRARQRGLMDWPEIAMMASSFEREFMEDMDELGVKRPDALTRVTEYIPEIIAYIERITENGMAYEAEGSVYFDVEAMGIGYGKLGVGASDLTTPNEAAGGEGSDLRGKRSHKDFALWKRAKPDEPWWESPFGRGRPGWHIECSAMTHAIFGQNLDLHSGGIDLRFPHHTNEIAQCEAYACGQLTRARGQGRGDGAVNEKPWVKHWLHTGHLNIEGLKMSKSLKNFITVGEYLGGYSDGRKAAAEDFRMFCLMHKYSSSVTFSEDRMEEAKVLRRRLERFLALADSTLRESEGQTPGVPRRWGEKEHWLVGEISSCRREVRLALSDDFDTPKAVRHLAMLAAVTSTHINSGSMIDIGPVRAAAQFTQDMLAILGLGSSEMNARANQGFFGRSRLGQDQQEEESMKPLPPTGEVIGAMVELRRAMRQLVLARNLKEKNCVHAAKQMKRDLLELADRTRDETLRNMGIQVDDGPKNTCTWMVLPPSTRSSTSMSSRSHTDQLLSPAQTTNNREGGSTDVPSSDSSEQVPPWLIGTVQNTEGGKDK